MSKGTNGHATPSGRTILGGALAQRHAPKGALPESPPTFGSSSGQRWSFNTSDRDRASEPSGASTEEDSLQ